MGGGAPAPFPTPTEPPTDQASGLLYLLHTPGLSPSSSLSGSFLVALMRNPCVILKSCQILLLGIKSNLLQAEMQGGFKRGSEEWLVGIVFSVAASQA